MQPNQPDAHTRNLRATLEEMASVSANILKSGAAGNDAEVRSGVDRMRQLRSNINAMDRKYHAYFDARPESEKIHIGHLIKQYKKAEPFCKAWTQRFQGLLPYEVLLEMDDGPSSIVDMHLPEVWDWESDIILFSHESDIRLIQTIVSRGQKRVLAFSPEEKPLQDRIENVVYITKPSDIESYFQNLTDFHPTQISIFEQVSKNHESNTETLASFNKIKEKLQKIFDLGRANESTVRLFGNRWLIQGVQNLTTIAEQPSFKHLAANLTAMPLVIISPGPSLDKNINSLKDIRDQAILLAPAQSIKALQKANIFPDIVMVADPGDLLYLFEDFDITKVHAVLLGVSCHPEIYARFKNKVISFNVNGDIDSWISKMFDDDFQTGSSGSVSSMAFLLAGVLNCSPIILVGQDLSFAGNKQYSDGASDGQVSVNFDEKTGTHSYGELSSGLINLYKENLGQNYQGTAAIKEVTLTLPGYYGGTVYTKYDYSLFHHDFERRAAEYLKKDPPPKLYNCTEGGAYISGFDHISLVDAINKMHAAEYRAIDKSALFDSIFISVEREERRAKLYAALSEINTALTSSLSLANQCHATALNIIRGRSPHTALAKHEQKLTQAIDKSNFIAMAIQDEIRGAIRLGEAATTLKENLEAKLILYQLVIREAKKLHPYILTAIKSLEAARLSDSMIIGQVRD